MKAVIAVLLIALAACGDAAAPARDAALAAAQAALASDPSAALHLARAGLADHGADPRLSLVAGLACLQLDRRQDAIAAADEGLAAADLPADLRADLSWVRGAALMARYRELSDLDDWRGANGALEDATVAGAHRVRAATALALLQDLSEQGSQDRQLRFARLVLELEPDGEAARTLRAVLERKGLSP